MEENWICSIGQRGRLALDAVGMHRSNGPRWKWAKASGGNYMIDIQQERDQLGSASEGEMKTAEARSGTCR